MEKNISTLFLLVILSVVCFGQKAEKTEGPLLVFDNVEHDFGKVQQNQKLEYSFHFTNEGTDTLRVLRVKSS